jgi:hypothetical protein
MRIPICSKPLSSLLLILITAFFSFPLKAATVPTSERNVLLNLYQATGGANWANHAGWGGPVGTECSWFGVYCTTPCKIICPFHVSAIDLISNRLIGSIAAVDLDALPSLEYFDVTSLPGSPTRNNLSGTIPDFSLTSMNHFGANGNALSGPVPNIASNAALQYFDVGNNQLTGPFPDIGSLSNLQIIILGGNSLTGPIPIASSSLDVGASSVCPNKLDHTNSSAWDQATGISPWYQNCVVGQFVASDAMIYPRQGHTATTLASGLVLITGGELSDYVVNISAALGPDVSYAEMFSYTLGSFQGQNATRFPRTMHAAALLPDNWVLIAGGEEILSGTTVPIALATAELFNPTTGQFMRTGNMRFPRVRPMAAALPVGYTLIAGGDSSALWTGNSTLSSAEMYEPSNGTFYPVGSMSTARVFGTATVLQNGMVLIAGGVPDDFGAPLSTAELFNPITGQFSLTGQMVEPHVNHTATLLPNGKVLIAGGYNGNAYAGAELYDPATGQFTSVGSLNKPRSEHTATLLPSGEVLIAGGMTAAGDVAGTYIPLATHSAERFDPVSNKFTYASGSLRVARAGATANLLPDGSVLIAGGYIDAVSNGYNWGPVILEEAVSTGEIYRE